MAAVRCFLASAAAVCLLRAGPPSYTAAGIVNAAANAAGPLAPYTLVTIYGTELAYSTRAADLRAGADVLEGVRVLIDRQAAPLYFVSPTQINFLMPYDIGQTWPTEATLTVVLNGVAGPAVRVTLQESAPALFLQPGGEAAVVAAHADWTPVTRAAPARPDEEVVLLATGLGRTNPPVAYPEPPKQAARVQASVLLGGTAVPADRVSYAGVMPGFAGLYQVNVRLPAHLEKDPEVRIVVGERTSPPGVRLPCSPE